MPGKRPNIERVSWKDYEELYPQRLERSQIDEQSMFSLMMRSSRSERNAYRVPVRIENIQHGLKEAAFKTILLDADLQPATRKLNSFMNEAHTWLRPSMSVLDNGARVAIPEGFLVPPQLDDLDWSLLESIAMGAHAASTTSA